MIRKMKRLVALALSATLALSVTAPVHALRYQGSSQYMSGKYYRALTEVRLTGDQRTDIVNVALSQVGYQEGGNRNQLSGEVYGGENITEYGRWYGLQSMWCAMFASWCANTAGIGTDIVPRHAYTPEGLKWFQDRGLAYSRKELTAGVYTPRPGDLIYFRSSRNQNRTNHVGIVVAFEDGKIYTVEGNIGGSSTYSNGGMVRRVSYPVGNEYIVAVCSPRYQVSGTRAATDPTEALRQAIVTAEGSTYGQVVTAYTDTIALGIGNWYGTHARSLLAQLREEAPEVFEELDTCDIARDLDDADWDHYRPDQDKLQCISALIGSEAGHSLQDRLLAHRLEVYMTQGREQGIHQEDAQEIYALLCWLCGATTAEGVLSQIVGAPTADALLATLSSPRFAHLHTIAATLTN